MTSLDLIDSVLRIGDNGLGNGLFVAGFEDFYQRQFSPSGIRFNGAQFLYMLYGAILSLPLTEKITKHNIDGLLVAKKGNNLKLMVSYATLDNSLSLKLIHFDASLRPSIPTTEQSIVLDARKHLTSIKNRHIDLGELKSALKETHEVTFTYKIDHGPVTVIPKLSKSPCDIDRALMSPFFKFTELALVQENQRAESASSFVKQLQSDVYDVVKYNSHAFTRLLIMQHQIMASDMRLQLSLNYDYMYLFLIGAMEINWARSYRLIIRPIFETSGRAIQGLMISHAPFKKSWKSESTPFVVKLLTSTLSPHTKDYNDDMYNKIVDGLPYTQTEKVIVVGIEHNKLIEAFKKPMDVPSFQLLPYTYLLDMNPMENLVDILLQPYTDSTLSKINFCIKNLNQKGKYGLHTYLYGQLMSFKKYDIEKYIFHDSNLKQGRTTFVFKLRGTDTGVLFDIFQTSPLLQIRDDILSNFEGHSLPTHLLNIKHLLRIAVHQIHEMMDGRTERVRLTRSYAHFLDAVQLQQRQVLLGNWLPVPTMSPEYVLANIERRIEAYKELDTLDILHVMLDSIDTNLLQFRDKVSIEDIVHFMSGLYSDWNRIFYHGFLGILKSDGTPLFISSLETSGIYQQHLVTAKLREISAKYIRFDYIPNPLRRIANFVCITRNSQNENKISIARLSTFQKHKAAFESCLAHNMVRMKRRSLVRIPCIADEVPEHTNEALGDDGKLPSLSESDKLKRENPIRTLKTIKMKISPHLETVNKVSKVIMTAQMFKDMVGALIRGDYKAFAVNTAFLASGPLLECLSMKMIAKGASIGDSLLGRSLLISAPFMGRLPIMGFVGFDLYEQVKSYKNGDKGAMVNIMGDSSILTIDFAIASVEGAEALGVISGVADIAGPIGFAIGTAIFVGVDIYNSVKAVSNIDAMVHLTSWQKFTTGFLSFLHVSPTKTVQKELFEKNAADASIENAANFFKNHPSVKYYLFPSYQDNGKFVENNIIDLRTNVTRIAHSWPKDIANTKLICAGNSKLPVYKTSRLLLNCSNSFGYESTSKDETVVILIGNGNDTVKTFTDKSTTFLIGNGHKKVIGSSENDLFILDGNNTLGYIDGKSGKNVLNLVNFASTSAVRVNFLNRQLTYSGGKIRTYNIHNVIGRPLTQDTVICDCSTKYVDTQGGSDTSPDILIVKKNCHYDTTIKINGTINVKNEAVKGNFQYMVSKNFQAVLSQKTALNTASRFIFEHNLEDLNELEIVNLDNTSLFYNITFKTNDGSTLKIGNILHNTAYVFKDYSELRINNGSVSINAVSNDTVAKIYEKYLLLSEKLNGVVNLFSILKNISVLFGSGKVIHHGKSSYYDNHINILPNDPNHETYLVGGENQNVFRISVPYFHNSNACSLAIMPSVTIMNYAYNNFVNVIDLYEITLLVREKFFGQVIVDIEAQGSNLVLKVFVGCPTISFTNVINVTLKDALEIENYKHVVVNMRRPMTIMSNDNSTFLVPEDYILKNGTYALISNDLVEPYTTIVSQKLLSDFDFTIYNGVDLILTNVKHVADESNLIFMVFKDFSYFDELRTLRLKFSDRVVELPQKINGVTIEFQDFEDFLQSEEYE